MKAIVYTSQTGSAAEYARLLGKAVGLPAYTVSEAKKALAAGDEILYIGWVMASVVQGYKASAARYRVAAVCAVGLSPDPGQSAVIRAKTGVPDKLPLFMLQGNFALARLHGIQKLVMKMMLASLAKTEKRTAEEEEMYCAVRDGVTAVAADKLCPVREWYAKTQKQEEGTT